jgi:hypothetical protein
MLDYLKSMCRDVFSDILKCFLDDLHKEFDGKENIDLSQINAVFNLSLKKFQEMIKKAEDEKVIKLDSDFIDSNSKTIQTMSEVVFEYFPLSKKQITEITGILKLVFQKGETWMESYNHTGIVIAGYGEREIFPAIYSFKVGGKLGDSLVYFGIDKDQVGIEYSSCIRPFAQTEMVHQFIRGLDISFLNIAIEKVESILRHLLPSTNDASNEKISAISDMLGDYFINYTDITGKKPIVEIVTNMQTSELASMAEAMVNLTALKRHVSTDTETVGGPIDVAIITRGEGFIWIKRKTNYDPHLNRHLSQKYFRGGEK